MAGLLFQIMTNEYEFLVPLETRQLSATRPRLFGVKCGQMVGGVTMVGSKED
jgi:hypothetical protein